MLQRKVDALYTRFMTFDRRSSPELETVTSASGLSVTGPEASQATVGVAFTMKLTASGGTSPYTFTLQAGSLPGGLLLTGATGVISGTPTTVEFQSFTIRCTDSAANIVDFPCSINVSAYTATLAMRGNTKLLMQYGVEVNAQVFGVGGSTPYTYSIIAGGLPTGVGLDVATGSITGIPTGALGPYLPTLQVQDNAGSTSIIQIAITVLAAPDGINTVQQPLLVDFTFTDNSPIAGSVAWSAGRVVYKGVVYSVTSGNTANGVIYWQLGSPTVFGSAATTGFPPIALPALGADDWVVGVNDYGGAGGTNGLWTSVRDFHPNANNDRLLIGGDFVAGYDSNRSQIWNFRRTNANPGPGIMELLDGTFGTVNCRMRGDQNMSSVYKLTVTDLVINDATAAGLKFANQTVSGAGKVFQGYIAITVGANTYYVECYQ